MPAHEDDANRLLTVQDICEWFNVAPHWVYDEVEAGRLPHIKLGRRALRFELAVMKQYLDERSRGRRIAEPEDPLHWSGMEPLD